MKKKLLIAGYIIGFSGFGFVALGGDRSIGLIALIIGFCLVAIGIIGSVISMEYPSNMKRFGLGIKVGAIGFAIVLVGLSSEFISKDLKLTDWLFYFGLIITFVGVLLSFLRIKSASKK